MIINTVGDIRKIIEDLDDDFKLDGYLEFQDVTYSDKELYIGVYER